jgi:PPOX class probable F420-dependent enzyme
MNVCTHRRGSPTRWSTGMSDGHAVMTIIDGPRGSAQGTVLDMAHQMIGDELDRFLTSGTRTGKLATTRADGSPHVAPVWFILDGDDLVFMTGSNTVKGRAMLRDPRAALLVDDEQAPYAFAIVEGTVSIIRDADEMLPLSIAIARRYMGDEQADQYGRRNAVEGELLVRLHRDKVTAVAEVAD